MSCCTGKLLNRINMTRFFIYFLIKRDKWSFFLLESNTLLLFVLLLLHFKNLFYYFYMNLNKKRNQNLQTLNLFSAISPITPLIRSRTKKQQQLLQQKDRDLFLRKGIKNKTSAQNTKTNTFLLSFSVPNIVLIFTFD